MTSRGLFFGGSELDWKVYFLALDQKLWHISNNNIVQLLIQQFRQHKKNA